MAAGASVGVDSLSEELLFDIMSRLSRRNLYISRCVCKKWRNIISSILQERSKQNPRLLIAKKYEIFSINDSNKLPQLASLAWDELDDDRIKPRYESYTSKNLINISRFVADANNVVYFDFSGHMFIYNTITKEFFTLPYCSYPLDYPIAYDCKSHTITFGYLDSLKEFKVARLFIVGDITNNIICKIITVGKDDDWRVINFPFYLDICNQQGVMVDEAFHWMIYHYPCYHPNDPIIASLNLETEKFTTILPPPLSETSEISCYVELGIGSIRGFLCLLRDNLRRNSAANSTMIMEIWMLKEDLWEKEMNIIHVPNLFCHAGLIPLYEYDGDILFSGICDNRLFFYDTEREIVREVGGQIEEKEDELVFYIHTTS